MEGAMGNIHPNTAALVILVASALLLSPLSRAVEHPRIKEGSIVTFLYQITIPGNTGVAVQDVGTFVQGRHQLLPALERAVNGMKPGDEKRVELSVEEGFGPYDAKKKKTVPKANLPVGIKKGDMLEDRAGTPAIVADLSDTSAVLDFNHPLAGKPLIVQITILEVENPS
jgi:FKBP-type peptidyl-prolyl cis-trans isomerase 2